MLCLVEMKDSKCYFFCCFVYAANSGKERKIMWKDLGIYKRMIDDKPWVLMGDWNVSLHLKDHSEGGCSKTCDMIDFQECLEHIEVEDLNCFGIHFTWVQSRQNPSNGILKKIDRVLGNENWNIHVDGCKIYKLVKRLKGLKYHMKKFSWQFGNIFEKVIEWKEKLQVIQKHKAKIDWLSDGDKNSKFFHSVLKGRAHKSRIETVNDENGVRHEGAQVAEQFVNHFQNFLGIASSVQNFDMGSLNSKVVCDEDAQRMIMNVSEEEIKDALFDICDNKAPGPDGYSAKFYKSAWSVIKNEVCDAIMEFFRTGRMLGEVNATLITLVPKSKTPQKVSDYRPISCCNIIYKIISKILTNRIKSALCKLVSHCQSAFIPGRQITDNILLTQELLRGYNWKNGARRVALKIDIQKAYDTIMVCVRTAAFTINVNGVRACYFKGGRGLRQALDMFSSVSGLNPNIGKSTVFFRNVKEQDKQEILSILPFKIGSLPVSYLGVPLITKHLTFTDCKVLIDKVKIKVNDWKNKMLSYAGRLQLIASILSSMQVYRASVFMLPKSVVNDINKLLKGFLWCQGELSKGKAKVAWKQVCKPKDEGGLGIKNLSLWNEVLMAKHLWNVATMKESLWVKWIHKGPEPLIKYIPMETIRQAGLESNVKLKDMIKNGLWKWPREWNSTFMHNLPNFVPKLIEGSKDSYLWETNDGKCKNFSTNRAWMDWRDHERKVDWCDLVWFSNCTPKHSFIVWMAVQDMLTTQERIMKWYPEKQLKCSLCGMKPDSLNYLFFECNYSAKVWKELMEKYDHYDMPNIWDDLLITMTSMRHNKSIKSVLRRIVFAACVYFIWNERNKRLFTNDKKNYNELIAKVVNHIRLKLASLTMKRTCQTVEIYKKWKVGRNVKTRYGVPEML
ncbi:RNA-directed DNA polymerase, eukaryota, reverse transcriptase zinc-binding domain protein [Tanacetum coccineum]